MITTELFIILSFFLSLKNSQVNICEYESGTLIAECTSFEALVEELTVLCEEDEIDAENEYFYELNFLINGSREESMYQKFYHVAEFKNTARDLLNFFKYTTELHFVAVIQVPDTPENAELSKKISDFNEKYLARIHAGYREYFIDTTSEDMFDAFCSSPVYRASEKQHWLYKYKAIPFDAFYKKDSIYETYDEYIEVNED